MRVLRGRPWRVRRDSGTVSLVFLFSSVIFNIFVPLYLKRISRRQHVTGSCLYSPPDNLWFLIEAFSSFIFNVIIDNGCV